MTDPRYAAFIAIEETMRRGSDKDGRNESWREKHPHYHLLKAIRHATTALMQIEAVSAPDGERHLYLAITRLAMALTQEKP